ncbi:MAG: outer membrane beta-barrel protein [Vicinamibacteria bacterium]
MKIYGGVLNPPAGAESPEGALRSPQSVVGRQARWLLSLEAVRRRWGPAALIGVLALLLVAAPAWAQRFEAAGLLGYTTAGSLDQVAPDLEDLEIGGGFTWSGQFDYFFSPHLGVEASWARREGVLTLTASSGTGALFEIDIDQLLGSVVYQWGVEESKIRPFVLGGIGATFFSADDIPSETKLAWAAGGGVKVFLHRRVGIKAQAKLNSTVLADSSSDFCDPFGFCSSSINPFELLSGVVFRF